MKLSSIVRYYLTTTEDKEASTLLSKLNWEIIKQQGEDCGHNSNTYFRR